MHRVVSGFLVAVVLASCTSDDNSLPDVGCAPPPERVDTDVPLPEDLSLELPFPRAPGAPTPPGTTPIAWGDLDGDGTEDLLAEDGDGRLRAFARSTGRGVVVDDRFRQVWPVDLDGRPGDDVVVPDAPSSTTEVWSGVDVLDGTADKPARTLPGLVRAITPESETLLLDPDVPAVRIAGEARVELRFPGEPGQRVQHVLVFDGDDGARRLGFQVDRRLAVWRWPISC